MAEPHNKGVSAFLKETHRIWPKAKEVSGIIKGVENVSRKGLHPLVLFIPISVACCLLGYALTKSSGYSKLFGPTAPEDTDSAPYSETSIPGTPPTIIYDGQGGQGSADTNAGANETPTAWPPFPPIGIPQDPSPAGPDPDLNPDKEEYGIFSASNVNKGPYPVGKCNVDHIQSSDENKVIVTASDKNGQNELSNAICSALRTQGCKNGWDITIGNEVIFQVYRGDNRAKIGEFGSATLQEASDAVIQVCTASSRAGEIKSLASVRNKPQNPKENWKYNRSDVGQLAKRGRVYTARA
ncbi:MAG: hypothetical protein WC744_00110 [Patescibacteria group bacterium]|jgi:hypothetical protein